MKKTIVILLVLFASNLFAEEKFYFDKNNLTYSCEDNTGYYNGKIRDKNDPHFGWELGRFFVTGYTRASYDETTNSYTLLKSIGNKITLYYTLEQDIDNLNGVQNLSIFEDKNGYDVPFQIETTNFGCGCLITQHTDYQGKTKEPVKYFNFLKAKCSKGADTSIQLLEEGDYIIKLNYEIAKPHIGIPFTKKSVFKTWTDYYTEFKIRIRNADCMVFPFDVRTGSELTNECFTPNGFYLDLAKSHYLKLSIQKEIIQGDALIADTRMNSAVNEGIMYTDEGIYTISANNPETGLSTTKIIYVGSNPLLIKYAKNQGKIQLYELIKQEKEDGDNNPTSPPEKKERHSTSFSEKMRVAGEKTRIILEKIWNFFKNLINKSKK